MSRFRPFNPEQPLDKVSVAGHTIRTLDDAKARAVREFEMKKLKPHTASEDHFRPNSFSKQSMTYEEEIRQKVEAEVHAKMNEMQERLGREAFEKGYTDGKNEGFQESFKTFQSEAGQHLEKITKFIETCETAKDYLFQENEKFLIDLIYRVTQTILLRELSLDREYLRRLVGELVHGLGVRESVSLKIHPEDAAFIQTLREDLLSKIDTLRNVNIELSDEVKLGGCFIETDWNAVDASVKTQLERLQATLSGPKDDSTA